MATVNISLPFCKNITDLKKYAGKFMNMDHDWLHTVILRGDGSTKDTWKAAEAKGVTRFALKGADGYVHYFVSRQDVGKFIKCIVEILKKEMNNGN